MNRSRGRRSWWLAAAVAVGAAEVQAQTVFGLNPRSLTQTLTDGDALCAGCTLPDLELAVAASAPVFWGDATGAERFRVEVELLRTSAAFISTPTHLGPYSVVSSRGAAGSAATVLAPAVITGLDRATGYKWRARVTSTSGAASDWASFNSANQAFVTGAMSPSFRLSILTDGGAFAADACAGPFQVALAAFDGGAPSPAPLATPFQLAANAPVSFFGDPLCVSAPPGTLLAGQTASSDVYVKTRAAGEITLTASSTSNPWGALTVTSTPGPATSLAFSTGPFMGAVGECLGPFFLDARDAFGNRRAPATAQPVSLSGPAGVAFYDVGTCSGAAISAVSVPSAASAPRPRIYVRGSQPVDGTIMASSALGTATRLVRIVDRILCPGTPITVGLGACSQPIRTQLLSTAGQPAVAPAGTSPGAWILAGSIAAFFYKDPDCLDPFALLEDLDLSIADGGTVEQVAYAKPPVAGSNRRYFRLEDLGTNVSNVIGVSCHVLTTALTPPTDVRFVSATLTGRVNECLGPLVVRAVNAAGVVVNVQGATTVSYSASAPGVQLFHDATCAGPPITAFTVADGTSGTWIYATGAVPGSVAVSVDAGALGSDMTLVVLLDLPDAGPPDAGQPDAGVADAGTPNDAGAPDAGAPSDAGAADAGPPDDAGAPDSGPRDDGGAPDAGTPGDGGPGPADAGNDGGVDGPPRRYGVGCGCNPSPSASALQLLAALSTSALRARRRRCRGPSDA